MPDCPLMPVPVLHELLRQALDGFVSPLPDLTHFLDRMESRK